MCKQQIRLSPYKPRRVSEKTYLEIQEFFQNAPSAPVEQLQKEAKEFEKMMLERRNAKISLEEGD